MIYANTVLFPWLLNISGIICGAAIAMPMITALGLIVGRRGNAAFCLLGANCLFKLCLGLGILGIFHFPVSYLAAVAGLNITGSIWSLLLIPAGYSYWSAAIAWFCAVVCLFAADRKFKSICQADSLRDNKYLFAFIKWPFVFLLATSAFYLTSLCLENWPFGGLPKELSWDRAFMAILRHSIHRYFMDFCPAGAIALLFAPYWLAAPYFLPFREEGRRGKRWLALWAFAGCLPYCVQTWGLVIGLCLRGNLAGNLAAGLDLQIASLACLTLGIVCWGVILLHKNAPSWLAWCGFAFLLLRDSAPWLIKTWRYLSAPV